MNKDAFYFPHFCNARHDRKIRRLRKELGLEGYGIFFMLLETLREQTDYKYPLEDIDLLSDEYGTSEAKLKTVLTKYDLFQLDEKGMFFSSNLIMYLRPYMEGKEKKRINGIRGNLIRYNHISKAESKKMSDEEIIEFNENLKLESRKSSLSDRTFSQSKVKESKLNEIKEKEIKDIVLLSFENFWNSYNKKVGRKKSFEKYKLLSKKNILPDINEHIEIIEKWHKTKKWKDGYQPHPTTWLNGELWDDEFPREIVFNGMTEEEHKQRIRKDLAERKEAREGQNDI